MLKQKNKLFVVILLNAALIISPVQMTQASVMPTEENSSHKHNLKTKSIRRCKHNKTSVHSSKNKIHASSSLIHKMSENKTMKMDNHVQTEACQCPSVCADCCGGHATVALHDFEFYQFVKLESSQPDNNLIHYTPIFIPIETPPPLA